MPASKGTFLTILVKKTCAKQLYTAGIDEQDIMARTGHRSETPVRKQQRGGAYLIFSVLKRVKGRIIFQLSAMKQKQ